MRLRDRVDILHAAEKVDRYGQTLPDWTNATVTAAGLPADVHYTTTALLASPGRTAMVEELRAVVEPRPFDPTWDRLRWRGDSYAADGPAMIRRRNGIDHHLTIPLKRVTG